MGLVMSEQPWFSPHRLIGEVSACRLEACRQGREPCPCPAVCRVFAQLEHDTEPQQPEAASGCYEPPAEPVDKMLSGYLRGIVSALLVGAVVALVLVVTR